MQKDSLLGKKCLETDTTFDRIPPGQMVASGDWSYGSIVQLQLDILIWVPCL